LVIHYEFLWSHEFQQGLEEGEKRRPCVIILAEKQGQDTVVTVAPITHRPHDEYSGMPVPLKVKGHLGLDNEPSWIVFGELNEFNWPGRHIYPVPGRGGNVFEYGFIPRPLLIQTRDALLAMEEGDRNVMPRID
jgi:hypothetical protein